MARLTSVPARQIVINPNYEVPETDYSNNVLKCRCRYDGHRVWMYSCHNGTDTCRSPAGSCATGCHTHTGLCLVTIHHFMIVINHQLISHPNSFMEKCPPRVIC